MHTKAISLEEWILIHTKVISISAEDESCCIQKWFYFKKKIDAYKSDFYFKKKIDAYKSDFFQEENLCIQKWFLFQSMNDDAYKSDIYFSQSMMLHTKVISISAEA